MSRRVSMYRPGNTIHRRTNQFIHQDVFPLLDSKEITICLQSCDFIATEELVSRPTSQFMKTLFEQFLDTFMGISASTIRDKTKKINKHDTSIGRSQEADKDNFAQEEGEREEEDDDDDDTSEALNLIMLHRGAHKFLQGCGIHDLTLMDIMRPEPYRTRRILSAVVNFARFREEHSAECEHLVIESEESLERIRKSQGDNEKTTNQLRDLKARIEASEEGEHKKATLKQINSYNTKLENELKKLKKSQELLTLEHSQYKVEKARLIEKLEDQNYLILEFAKELEKLKTYSSTDLDVLNQIIADLKSQIIDYQSSFSDMESKDRNLSITIESMQIVEGELKSLFRILEEIMNDLLKEKNAFEELNSTQEYLDQQNAESNDLGRQIQQYERQLVNTQDKINKLKLQAEERIKKSQQQLASYRSDYTKLVEERNLKEKEFTKKKELIADIEAKINKKKSDFQIEVKNLDLKIARLNAQIKLYLDEVGKKVFEN
ncbi:uncharacterized protein PRCAT00005974001 [Priceomyces carsonii]|uniref:uncharacterized protein n=1 Tax=Priceomyces carsonii TaxID=28549 RepID=UPI002ED99E81|nr:unnamed protein product [Priceomyces carsonii]